VTTQTSTDTATAEHAREAIQASMDRRDNGGEAGH
jgi:hypothetical protein